MDAAVLIVFALFFTALVVATTVSHGVLRTSVRRPRLFQTVVVLATAATVPVDLYAVVYGTVGPGGAVIGEVAGRLLLLNVAAACGVAALHESSGDAPSPPPRNRTNCPRPSSRCGWACWAGPAH